MPMMKARDHNLRKAPPRIRAIVDEVLQAYADEGLTLTYQTICADDGMRTMSAIRQEIWAKARESKGPSNRRPTLLQLGGWFNRDHTSIAYGLRKYAERMAGS